MPAWRLEICSLILLLRHSFFVHIRTFRLFASPYSFCLILTYSMILTGNYSRYILLSLF